MARVPLSEPVFSKQAGNNALTVRSGVSVYVYKRGTETQATLYAAETGETTVTQPLTTNASGLPTSNGSQVWMAPGSYSVQIGSASYPFEASVGSTVAVVEEAPLNVEYRPYGADGTQATDSTEAFQKAIAALPAEGGAIFAPRKYKLSGKLNLDEKRAVRIIGQAGMGSGKTSISQLLFTQSGSEALISARSTQGFGLSDIQVEYTSGIFTGPCIDLSHGGSGEDSSAFALSRFQIRGASVNSALGIDLDKVASGSIRDFQIAGLDIGIRGMKEKTGYSNVVTFDSGIFTSIATVPMKNAGVVWNVVGITFAPLVSGKAGAYSSDAEFFSRGLSFRGCYMGDANTEGTWVTFRGNGLGVSGGMIGSGALGVYVPDSTSEGIGVSGGINFWSMTDAIRFNFGAGTQHYNVGGDVAYTGVTGKKLSVDNGATDLGAGPHSH